jgi:outer membrane protein assembly factor BamB
MHFVKSKTTATTMALFLALTITATIVALPTVNAHTPAWNIKTYAFLNVAPSPVGVNQEVTLVFWLNLPPPTANGPYGDRWHNFSVAVTSPSGKTETLGPFQSDPVGSGFTTYTPIETGRYTFKFSFSGMTLANDNPNPNPNPYSSSPYIGDYFEPSTSPEVALNVTEEPVQPYPASALPTGYWQRPIDANNREWYTISGDWLAGGGNRGSYNASGDSYFGGGFNPYTTAPDSAHIVWTKPLSFGGIIGGTYGGGGTSSYYNGMNYEPKMDPPVVMNGVLYYNTPNPPLYGFNAVDLRTGQTLWWHNTTDGARLGLSAFGTTPAYPGITCGQIYDYVSPNQFGGIPYLWYISSPNYYMYDAITGNWILTLNNSMRGTVTYGPDGSLIVYVLDGAHNWLAMWNSSMLPGMYPTNTQPNGEWMWRPPIGATLDWRTGIQWNVTVTAYQTPAPQSIARIGSDVILATTGSFASPTDWQMEIGYSIKDGHQLWVQNRTLVPGTTSFSLVGPMQNGVFLEFQRETMTWYCYSATTGEQIWGPTTPYTEAFGMYQNGAYIAYGRFYAIGYDGMVHCFDLKTGENLWNWYDGSSGYETVYGHNPFFSGPTIADGKVYASEGHTHLQPLFRGARMVCLNSTSGDEIWSILGWMQSPIVADGYLIANNGYDNQLYCFGKGQTATTVTASDTALPPGSSVVIHGTVTDQSPGNTCLGIPAAGTPAISDDSMDAWMEYLYMQQPMPTNATGVEVTLDAVDPNNNFVHLGTATSDMSGNFGFDWKTPNVPGDYTIIATFAGSNSYYASYAETYAVVSAAPAATPPAQTATQESPMLTYVLAAVIALIIVVVASVVLLLRRK